LSCVNGGVMRSKSFNGFFLRKSRDYVVNKPTNSTKGNRRSK
jgi:hypothetical protein